jgi:diadenosine tetraphosphate (Ap4A) HIT family hydrolase
MRSVNPSATSDSVEAIGHCVLCEESGGDIVWSNSLARVVNINDQDHPGFCRVILQRHVREMTDLTGDARAAIMRVVFAAELAQRRLLSPDKINLASFGNMVAHLHWHVIPRFTSDPHYPNPVWGNTTAGIARPLPDNYWQRFGEELNELLGPAAGA